LPPLVGDCVMAARVIKEKKKKKQQQQIWKTPKVF
jgi:hypothetical protein